MEKQFNEAEPFDSVDGSVSDPAKAESMARAGNVHRTREKELKDRMKVVGPDDRNFYKLSSHASFAHDLVEQSETAAGILYELQDLTDRLVYDDVEQLKELLDKVKSRPLPTNKYGA